MPSLWPPIRWMSASTCWASMHAVSSPGRGRRCTPASATTSRATCGLSTSAIRGWNFRNVLELDVEFINRGCSGMGGTFGLARDRFRTSLRAGRGLLGRLRDGDIEIGATECGPCRIQMEQGITKHTLHPIKLLSMGYGLNPTLRQHFKSPKPRHRLS